MSTKPANRAVFFDRDGVLIATEVRDGKPYAIKAATDLQILPGVTELINYYRANAYKIVVITNQPDVGNGLTPRAEVEAMHQRLAAELPLDLIKVCYHRQQEGCACRKPGIGMLLEAAEELAIDLTKSIMVGDRPSDIVAGKCAGCFTIFIDYRYNEQLTVEPDLIVGSPTELLAKHSRGYNQK